MPLIPAPKPVEQPNKGSASVKATFNQSSNDAKKAARELQEVETTITALEKELAAYEAILADPGIYSNASQLKDATLKFDTVKKDLEVQTQRWENMV